MDNYIEYKLSKVRARMKKDVVPHIFRCQPDRQTPLKSRILSEKRQRKKEVADLIKSSENKKTMANEEQIQTECKSAQVNMQLTKDVAISPIKVTISENKMSPQKRLRLDSEENTVNEIKINNSAKEESGFQLDQISQSNSSSKTYYELEAGKSKQFRKAFIQIMKNKIDC